MFGFCLIFKFIIKFRYSIWNVTVEKVLKQNVALNDIFKWFAFKLECLNASKAKMAPTSTWSPVSETLNCVTLLDCVVLFVLYVSDLIQQFNCF